jgi:hypothetical protein
MERWGRNPSAPCYLRLIFGKLKAYPAFDPACLAFQEVANIVPVLGEWDVPNFTNSAVAAWNIRTEHSEV